MTTILYAYFSDVKWSYWWVIGLLCLSCTKDDLSVQYSTVGSPVNEKIRSVRFINNQYVFCGGEIDGNGFVLQGDKELRSVTMSIEDIKWPLFDVAYFENRYVFSSRRAELMYADDSLKSHQFHIPIEENWVLEHNKQPVRQIAVHPDSTQWFAAGGGEFQFGLLFTSHDSMKTWVPQEFDNELRTVCFTPEGKGWIGGNGMVLSKATADAPWEREKINHQFVTDFDFWDGQLGVYSTYNAGIFRTSNGGDSWSQEHKAALGWNQSLQFNRIKFISKQHVIAVGQKGAIAISKDGGRSWKSTFSFHGTDLYDLERINDFEAIVVGENGNIYRVNI